MSRAATSRITSPLSRSIGRAVSDELFVKFLETDDWEIVEVSQLSGKPAFEGRREAVETPTEALDLDDYEQVDDPQVIRDHLRRIDRDLALRGWQESRWPRNTSA
jgi:hypothetical protein